MSLLARLLALFVLVPLVELVILVRMGQWLGFLPTAALVVVTGIAGAALARREGLRTFSQIRSELAVGRLPAGRMFDGVLILLAGGLLLTPGVLTDLVGLALLAPPGRELVRRAVLQRVRRAVERGTANVTIIYDDRPPGRAL